MEELLVSIALDVQCMVKTLPFWKTFINTGNWLSIKYSSAETLTVLRYFAVFIV